VRLQLARWGNSVAVRLPVEYLRAAGLKEGDEVEAEVTPMGEIKLTPAKAFDKATFLERLDELRAGMPMTEPVIEQLRNEE
jgi:antitoxin MazE